MARAVLSIQLPRTPDQIRAMIQEINNLLSSATDFQKDLMDLEEQAKTAQDLQQEAQDLEYVPRETPQLIYLSSYLNSDLNTYLNLLKLSVTLMKNLVSTRQYLHHT